MSIRAEGQPVMIGWPSSVWPDPRPGRRQDLRIHHQVTASSPDLDQVKTVWNPLLGRLVSKRIADRIPTGSVDRQVDPDQVPIYAPVIKDFIAREENRLCPGHVVPGVCEHGHRYVKSLFCGRQWCPRCGAIKSEVHERRIARTLTHGSTWSKPDKNGKRRILGLGVGFRQFRSLSQIVFTIPESNRLPYRSLRRLSALGCDITALCKRYGFAGGYRYVHLRGNKSNKWNPHWNVIAPGGHMAKDKLTALKTEYARLLGVSTVDVYYSYTRRPSKMSHLIRYVTRATMTDLSDPNIAYNLKGFMASAWWGSRRFWKGAPVWGSVSAVEKLGSHQCPQCGGAITWLKTLPISVIRDWERSGLFRFTDLEGGYYSLDPPAPDPLDSPDPGGRALLSLVRGVGCPG